MHMIQNTSNIMAYSNLYQQGQKRQFALKSEDKEENKKKGETEETEKKTTKDDEGPKEEEK